MTGVDIVAVVGAHVKLTAAGVNWHGVCPFCPPATRGETLAVQGDEFFCYGCGTRGDVDDWERYRKWDWPAIWAEDVKARAWITSLPRCRHCGAPMACGQDLMDRDTHYTCEKGTT
jgi:hypothetical protein